MVYVDNLVQGRAPGRADPDRARARLVDRRRASLHRSPRSSRPSGGRSPTRGSRCRPNRVRVPDIVARVAELADADDPAHRPLSPADPRARRDEQEHRLRHHGRPARSRLRTGDRAVRRHAAQHPMVSCGRARTVTTSLVTGGSGYFGSLLVDRLVERGHRGPRVRPQRCRRPSGRRRVRGRRHPRCRRGRRRRCRAATSSSTTSLRCRWRRIIICCGASTSTAPEMLLDAVLERPGRQGRPHVVERSVRRARVEPGAHRAPCPSRRRRTGTPSWRPSGHVSTLPATVSTCRSFDRERSSGTAGWGSSGSCSTGSPTVPIRSCSATAPTATSSYTPKTSPTPASRPAPPSGPACSTSAPIGSARCTRRSTICAPTPAPARRVRRLPGGPAAAGMQITARLGLTPFAPYHWLMYSKSMWFDIDHAAERQLGWTPKWSTDEMFAESYDWFVAHRTETRDADASHHRRSAQQGVLAGVKHLTQAAPVGARRPPWVSCEPPSMICGPPWMRFGHTWWPMLIHALPVYVLSRLCVLVGAAVVAAELRIDDNLAIERSLPVADPHIVDPAEHRQRDSPDGRRADLVGRSVVRRHRSQRLSQERSGGRDVPRDEARAAFFPLFPLLGRWFDRICPGAIRSPC